MPNILENLPLASWFVETVEATKFHEREMKFYVRVKLVENFAEWKEVVACFETKC